MSGLDLYETENGDRLSALKPTDTIAPGVFDGFIRGTGMETMRQFARTGRAIGMAGSIVPIVEDAFTGGTTAQDRYFKELDERVGSAVKAWTPEPNEVGVAGQVTGTLLSMIPMVMANPALAIANMGLGIPQDLVEQYGEEVSAGKAVAAGTAMSLGLGLGIKVPIFGRSLFERVLLGGVGFNVIQGAAMRKAAQIALKGTPAEKDFEALNAMELTIDALLGAAFGTIAHLSPAQRAEGQKAWETMERWGKAMRGDQKDALIVMRSAQHTNVDTLPGTPTSPEAMNSHVEKVKAAIDQTLRGEPVNVENVGVREEAPAAGTATLPDSLISQFPDMPTTVDGLIALQVLRGDEAQAIRDAGLATTGKAEDGSTYEGIDPEILWTERKLRQSKRSSERTDVTDEEWNSGVEKRAAIYDRLADEQDALAELGDTAKAAEYRQKADEIRQAKRQPDFEPIPERFTEAHEFGMDLQREAERIRAEEGLPPVPEDPRTPSKVYTATKAALEKIGIGERFGADYVENAARIRDAFYKATAKIVGQTADALFARKAAEITKDAPGTAAMLEQQTPAQSIARFWRSRVWGSEDEARQMIRDRIVQDNERYPMFTKLDPNVVDEIQFTRAKGGNVKVKLPAEKRLQPNWSDERPEGSTPDVDWYSRDNQDDGTPAGIKAEFGRGKGNLYQAWIPPNEIPNPRGDDIAAGRLNDDSGARDELSVRHRDGPPPLKVRIGPKGKVELLDGNHRLAYWKEQGYDAVPAWVIDERPQRMQPDNTLYQRRLNFAKAAEVWKKIAGNKEAFRYTPSESPDPQQIVKDMGLRKLNITVRKGDNEIIVTRPIDGVLKEARIGYDDAGQAWLDIADSKPGKGGDAVYQFAMQWAKNNDMIFIGDPAGVSPIAVERRTEQMVSGALRQGTTKYMRPDWRQEIKGWRDVETIGDEADLSNMALLLRKSYDNVKRYIDKIDDFRYDFDRGIFTDNAGNPVPQSRLDDLADEARKAVVRRPGTPPGAEPPSFRGSARDVERAIITRSAAEAADGRDPLLPIRSGALKGILNQDQPRWYSELTRQVESLKQETAPAAQWKGMLKNLKGVKADEIEWTGLNEWLDMQDGLAKLAQTWKGAKFEPKAPDSKVGTIVDPTGKMLMGITGKDEAEALIAEQKAKASGKVTRQQILDYLNSNGVKVDEVMKGGETWAVFDRRTGDGEEVYFGSKDEAMAYAKEIGGVPSEDIFQKFDNPSETKFGSSTLQLPGAKPGSYRELLLTLPAKESKGGSLEDRVQRGGETQFTRSHWDEANVLAHVRFNERTDADGKRVLFVEEIQSDWAQKGKKEGFAADKAEIAKLEARAEELVQKGVDATDAERQEWTSLMNQISKAKQGAIPTAPFVGKTDAWAGLVVKRMIRYAAENGFDRVAWTRGEQQVERYTNALRQVVDTIEWEKTPEGVQIVGYKGRTPAIAARERADTQRTLDAVNEQIQRIKDEHPTITAGVRGIPVDVVNAWTNLTNQREGLQAAIENGGRLSPVVDTRYGENELSDAIGKTLAEQIRNDPGQKGVIEGNNIRVDDTGMAGFYDRIVPNIANDILKKLGGGKVGEIDIDVQGRPETGGGLSEVRRYEGPYVTGEEIVRIIETADHPVEIQRQLRDILGAVTYGRSLAEAMNMYGSISAAEALGGTYEPVPHVMSKQPAFEITPALKARAMEGLPLFQKGGDQPRGFYEFGPDMQSRIGLLETANKSTFIHEMGHDFLKIWLELADEPNPPKLLLAELDRVFKWLEVDRAAFAKMSLEEQRPYHEQWGRGFEAFLREGRTSNPELTSAFQKFKEWLVEVYRSLTQMNVKLSDDVRGVMDRMLGGQREVDVGTTKETKSGLLNDIKALGGISKEAMLDVTGEKRFGKGVKGIPWGLFKDGGRGLDDLATSLRDRGWPIPEDDVDGGVQTLRDLVRSELEGERTLKAGEDPEAKPQDEADAEQIMRDAADQEEAIAEKYDYRDTPEYRAEIDRVRTERDYRLAEVMDGNGDPVGAEARRTVAENPDMAMVVGENVNGEGETMTARQYLDQAEAEYEQALKDAEMYKVAGDCMIGVD